jgi:predicted nucleic acid-binding protein
MITVSDTTPLRYLIEIEKAHILETLFGQVFIPEKVAEELQRPKTPQKVKDWMQSRPEWLEVKKADLSVFTPQKKINDGECEAFALALALKADAILIDDKDALPEAKRLNLQTISLFTIFERAAVRELIDLPQTVDEMRKTSFRLPPEDQIRAVLERDRKRKKDKARKKKKKQKPKSPPNQ